MRKVLATLVIAGALALGITSLASGAQPRCGTLYTQTCTKPVIHVRPIPKVCKKPGTTFTLPAIHVSSNAGIRSIVVKLGSKTLASKKFKGRGPTHYTLRGVKVSTKALAAGHHRVTITVKDVRGKTAHATLNFSVCHKAPVFTG